ncbi:MAG TPA: grasp-with-spasm system ATP-grasp peptide maturase [Thermoanaerobaculia bacterium]|nr:grasp-with-spasm system ATP-grasp peptide maturase [Thermoanaerobaculia bacterium]
MPCPLSLPTPHLIYWDIDMILILSQSAMEPTTEEVMDWLEAKGARCLRLNGEDFDGAATLRLRLDGGKVGLGVFADAANAGDTVELPLAEVGAVWYRRWMNEKRHEQASLLAESGPEQAKLHYDLRRHLNQELRRLSDFVFSRFAAVPWLSHPKTASLTKLDVLTRAAQVGLDTPATLVTTKRAELSRFAAAHHGRVITKPIGEVDLFLDGERTHFLFTTALDAAAIAALPERFAPSLFQEQLVKTYELRVFYLAGACHTMAIFSQADPRTRDDFRHYNRERPNRTVPYRLAAETVTRLTRLMADLDLETGSIDLLQTADGREVFLEVNPVGQFGMVSKPCNYHLERQVAELLIAKEAHGRRAQKPL